MSDESTELATLKRQVLAYKDLLERKEAEERQRKSTNLDFVQVKKSELLAIAELGKKNEVALNLLMSFVQLMDKNNAIMISFKAMENITGKSRSTLDRAIKVLKDDKWIQVVKVGNANAYHLNAGVFWSTHSDKKFGKFQATVVTSFDEQEKDLRKNPDVKLKRTPQVFAKEKPILLNDTNENNNIDDDVLSDIINNFKMIEPA